MRRGVRAQRIMEKSNRNENASIVDQGIVSIDALSLFTATIVRSGYSGSRLKKKIM